MKYNKGLEILRRSHSKEEIADFFLAPKLRPEMVLEILIQKQSEAGPVGKSQETEQVKPWYSRNISGGQIWRQLHPRAVAGGVIFFMIITLLSCAVVTRPPLNRSVLGVAADNMLEAMVEEVSLIRSWWGLASQAWPEFSSLPRLGQTEDSAVSKMIGKDVAGLMLLDKSGGIHALAHTGDQGYVEQTLVHLDELELENRILRQNLDALRDTIAHEKPYLEIFLKENQLKVKQGSQVLYNFPIVSGKGKRYLKGAGRYRNFSTPKGIHKIQSKEKNPIWYKPDWYWAEKGMPVPEDLTPEDRAEPGSLGKYRLNLGRGYGIHGTRSGRIKPGHYSHGCIRMNHKNLETVYKLVGVGAEVYIY